MPILAQIVIVIVFSSDDGVISYGNIMYDRRIRRGCAYAQTSLPAVS